MGEKHTNIFNTSFMWHRSPDKEMKTQGSSESQTHTEMDKEQ